MEHIVLLIHPASIQINYRLVNNYFYLTLFTGLAPKKAG